MPLIKIISHYLENKHLMVRYSAIVLLLALFGISYAQQPIVVDQVVAVVGNSTILLSDIEGQYLQMLAQKKRLDANIKCTIFENLLQQKLLVNQSKVDSVEISESRVESQLEARLKYFVDQIGSKENLEKYFNKPIYEIRNDLRSAIREQMITEKMQGTITDGITITPTEVKEFYASLVEDSIPMINAQVEYNQILRYPAYREETIYELKKKLLDIRKQIIDGRSFSALARLYSVDGSATEGGEIGFKSRGELDPAYANAAFALKENAVSSIVESQFGYHLIQLIARQGDKVNTRHILLKPKAREKEMSVAIGVLDSIVSAIHKDTLSFEFAAMLYSEDKNSSVNGGLVINPYNSSSKFELDQLNTKDYYFVRNMKPGDISQPFESEDENFKQAFKVIKLKSFSLSHKANLKEDYQILQEMALVEKKKKVIADWINDKIKTTYIKIDPEFYSCNLTNKGWLKK
jgi:peptidyl-prolyl cis-trans isomerase SurA